MRSPWNSSTARALAGLFLLALAACGTAPEKPSSVPGVVKHPPAARPDPTLPVLPPAGSGRGAYYKDDGPGENPPPGLADVPDAEVRVEAYSPRANRPYVVFGKTYTPMLDNQPFTQRGTGSWYGKKFHGQRTSSGELYDMYKMTAAHPTLPIPSYARLTSAVSGKQVIVRINDRGPFHASRVIDVSYTAALKLGLLGKGSHELLIERLLPADIDKIKTAARQAPVPVPALMPVSVAAPQVVPAVPPPLVLRSAAPAGDGIEVLTLGQAAAVSDSVAEAPLTSVYYLQLGAFARVENAESERARLAVEAGMPADLEVVKAGALYRVYGGPFANRHDAALAAQALPAGLKLKPIIVQR